MRDERGNTLAMAAAATIPLLGLVGWGIDLSRTYLAKNKLQQACDAGVLGGRKVMSTAVDAPVIAEVRKYVNFNFPQGTQQTAPFTINPTEGANKSVDLTLSTTVPTSVMHLFGFASLPITTSCTARQDFINTDVMLVLDTTLSMNCLPTDGNILCTTKKTNSKIDALKVSVVEFYRSLRDAQTRLEAAGLRLRYGIVPYSMSVNVGQIAARQGFDMDPQSGRLSALRQFRMQLANNRTRSHIRALGSLLPGRDASRNARPSTASGTRPAILSPRELTTWTSIARQRTMPRAGRLTIQRLRLPKRRRQTPRSWTLVRRKLARWQRSRRKPT